MGDQDDATEYFERYAVGADRGVLARREIEERLNVLRAEDRFAVPETPLDYARFVIRQASDVSASQRGRIPEGFTLWASRIGPPEREYPTPPVYEVISRDEVLADLSISRDPAKLLEQPPFRGWLIDFEQLLPWK